MQQRDRHAAAGCERFESGNRDAVVLADAVVVGSVGEGERQHALFFEVRLVDACERFDQYDLRVQEARFERRVLTRRPFAVVLLCDDDRADALRLELFGYGRNALVCAR